MLVVALGDTFLGVFTGMGYPQTQMVPNQSEQFGLGHLCI